MGFKTYSSSLHVWHKLIELIVLFSSGNFERWFSFNISRGFPLISLKYRKTSPKVIRHSSQSQRTKTVQWTNQNSRFHAADAKRERTRASESRLIGFASTSSDWIKKLRGCFFKPIIREWCKTNYFSTLKNVFGAVTFGFDFINSKIQIICGKLSKKIFPKRFIKTQLAVFHRSG